MSSLHPFVYLIWR